ncbi:efflux RND transporter periplasmic adaptor subunit [Caldimonas sp. KR1-144]|uniref:efflux RND transporter periplasmic adaptor subunit n=1 Tax=Caldimonas sp. KR1-144 TaxID=3400911 RepID=UPI003C0D6846
MTTRHSFSLLPVAVVAWALAGCGGPAEGQSHGAPQAAPVGVAAAVQRPVRDMEEFTGRLEAVESVDVRPRIGGTIDKVHFREGALVRAGDMLFTIDPRPYQAEVARAEAQLASAQSQSELARAELARAQKLLESKAVSRQEFDQLTSGARTSDANIKAAEAALRVARLNLEYTAVRAPIAGRISRANITTGNLVDDKTVLTTLVAQAKVYAYFDASEQTFLRLRKATADQLQVKMGLANEQGFPHVGKIDFIDNRLNPQTGAIRLRAVFDNAKSEFTPGLFARVQLAGATERTVVMTPDRALGTDQSKKFVLVVDDKNVAGYREVRPGPLYDGMRVIESGLKPGELVIVDGLQRARPGMPVAPEKLALDEHGMPVPKAPNAPAAQQAPAADKS